MGEQVFLKTGSICFEKGLPGFDGLKEFDLIAMEQVGFFNLSASEDENISLLLVDPYIYFPNYKRCKWCFDFKCCYIEQWHWKSNS